jgi:hypothetical protein
MLQEKAAQVFVGELVWISEMASISQFYGNSQLMRNKQAPVGFVTSGFMWMVKMMESQFFVHRKNR